MGVHRRERSGIVVLDISGEFYGDKETDHLEAAIQNELAAGSLHLILNLVACSWMNSTALGVMMRAKMAYDARGGHIRICGAERRMKSLLVVLRLYDWFDHHETEADAVEAFARPAEV